MPVGPMRVSLFWRTFLLVGGLIVASLLATLQLARVFERAPPEQKLAWEIASIVNLTRSALVSSEGERRRQLLDELAREEGVRVGPLEAADRVEPLPHAQHADALEGRLRAALGTHTRVAGKVNGEPGLWVSFEIDGDGFWLGLGLERLERVFGPPWWLVASLATALATLGALLISRLVNRPLASLADAIVRVSRGAPARPLPEEGPSEIAELNRRFNRMAADLAALESDRTIALAGISHDLRTPLTRLRMEIELSSLTEEEKASMSSDVERIDAIVGKFVEYARSGPDRQAASAPAAVAVADVVELVRDGYRAQAAAGDLALVAEVEPGLAWSGDPLDLARILSNLLENALRHGRADGEPARVLVAARRAGRGIELQVRDRGPGVPAAELERLLRPFARLDDARGERGGSGLGLAIVDRLAQRYAGNCRLSNAPEGGLLATVALQDAPVAAEPSR
jgi:two-component system osmolarity sensor histidine kinase EnvZ